MPEHHRRYALAWSLYTDPEMSEKSKRILMAHMDKVQESFEWKEFQQFKQTLPGYEEYWRKKSDELFATAQFLG